MAAADPNPTLTELKAFFGCDELHQAFKRLYENEHVEDELFIQFLGARRDELQRIIDKRTACLAELMRLSNDEEESAGDLYACEHKLLGKLRRRLEMVTGLLLDLREGLIEKEEDISMLEIYD